MIDRCPKSLKMLAMALSTAILCLPSDGLKADEAVTGFQDPPTGEWGGQAHSHDIDREKHHSFAVFVDMDRRVVRSGHTINQGKIRSLTEDSIEIDFPQSGLLKGRYTMRDNLLHVDGKCTAHSDGRTIEMEWKLTPEDPEPLPIPSGEWGGQAQGHDIDQDKHHWFAVFVDMDRRIVRSGHSISRGVIKGLSDQEITVDFPQAGLLNGEYVVRDNVLRMNGTATAYSDGRKIQVTWELTPQN
jgi:hypothetical protein